MLHDRHRRNQNRPPGGRIFAVAADALPARRGVGAMSRTLRITLETTAVFASFMGFLGGGSAAVQGETEKNGIAALVLIAQHGELRDLAFIQEALRENFKVNNNNITTELVDGVPIAISLSIESKINIFPKSIFNYSIFFRDARGAPNAANGLEIARLRVLGLDQSSCVTLDDVERLTGGVKPTVLFEPAPPPGSGLPSLQAYSFSIGSHEYYNTTIDVSVQRDNFSNTGGCIKNISISQKSV